MSSEAEMPSRRGQSGELISTMSSYRNGWDGASVLMMLAHFSFGAKKQVKWQPIAGLLAPKPSQHANTVLASQPVIRHGNLSSFPMTSGGGARAAAPQWRTSSQDPSGRKVLPHRSTAGSETSCPTPRCSARWPRSGLGRLPPTQGISIFRPHSALVRPHSALDQLCT